MSCQVRNMPEAVSPARTLAPLIQRSLAGDLAVHDHATDQRIMDAVVDELLVTSLRKLSLDDVARRAGVTRMTVYRRFGDRDAVLEATMARELSGFLGGIVAADDPTARPGERIASSFATALTLAHGHRLVAHMLATRPAELVEHLLADDGFLVRSGSEFIAAHLAHGDAEHPHPDPQRTGEILARLFVALVLMPPPSVDLGDPAQARELARDLVVPLVRERGRGDSKL